LSAIALTWSAFFGVTSNAAGSGFEERFLVRSGYFSFIRRSASSFEMKTASFVSGKVRIFERTALICPSLASCTKKTFTRTSLRT
jgi:hypothetical protein